MLVRVALALTLVAVLALALFFYARNWAPSRDDYPVQGLTVSSDNGPIDWGTLAAQGADLIVLPIWGGDETLAAARAIENKVFLVASGYDHPTYIMDPDGKRVAQAPQRGEVAVAEIDLARRYTDPWLGDMRTRRLKEIRLDVPTPLPGRLR